MWIRSTVVANLCIWSLTFAMPTENDMCDSGQRGYRYCESENAHCRNDPSAADGFVCYCDEGQIKVENLCKDMAQVNASTVLPELNIITSLPLPSSVISSSGTQTAYTNSNTFSEPETTFSSSLAHVTTTSDVPVIDTDECSGHRCSENSSCLQLSHGFTCICKPGFVPKKELFITNKHCIGNCTHAGCTSLCKQIKCLLKEEEDSRNAIFGLNIKNCSGWPNGAIIFCSILLLLLVVFVVSTLCLIWRYRKLKKYQQYEEKQIVYKKIEKNSSQCTESVREMLPKGVVVISYVFPNHKLAKDTFESVSSPC